MWHDSHALCSGLIIYLKNGYGTFTITKTAISLFEMWLYNTLHFYLSSPNITAVRVNYGNFI